MAIPFLTRRRALVLAGVAAGLTLARALAPTWLRRPPPVPLAGEAADFVDGLFEGLDRSRIWDCHAHVMGAGEGDTGCTVHPSLRSHLHPILRARWDMFLAVAGVYESEPDLDGQYLGRLLDLHRMANPPGRIIALAMDAFVDIHGRVRPDLTEFYTPNEYVLDVAAAEPDVEAGASIHPYREDAVERLEQALARGARLVKWLPAAQGIDPASPRCDAFYARLAASGRPLLTHAGKEAAVSTEASQSLGNPLRLRRPLEAGVRVVVAHCASTGEDVDLDAPEGRRGKLSSFRLFQRLLDDPKYERTLFADISALTQVNRSGRPLKDMLRAGELHHRLVNGSDYPLPAIDPLFSTRWLRHQGYLTDDEVRLCNLVFDANPLLFDFVVKRCVKVRQGGHDHRFAPTVFETQWLFG